MTDTKRQWPSKSHRPITDKIEEGFIGDLIKDKAVKIHEKTIEALSKRLNALREEITPHIIKNIKDPKKQKPSDLLVMGQWNDIAHTYFKAAFNMTTEDHVAAIAKKIAHDLLDSVSSDENHRQMTTPPKPAIRDGNTFKPLPKPHSESQEVAQAEDWIGLKNPMKEDRPAKAEDCILDPMEGGAIPTYLAMRGNALLERRESKEIPRRVAVDLTNKKLKEQKHDMQVSSMTMDKSWSWEKKEYKSPRSKIVFKAYVDVLNETCPVSRRIKRLKAHILSSIKYLHTGGPISWTAFERDEFLHRMAHLMVNIRSWETTYSVANAKYITPQALGSSSERVGYNKVSLWTLRAAEGYCLLGAKTWYKLTERLDWLEECHNSHRSLFHATVSWLIENRSEEWSRVSAPNIEVNSELKGDEYFAKWGTSLDPIKELPSTSNGSSHTTLKEGK